jgi:WD40 repeat protein
MRKEISDRIVFALGFMLLATGVGIIGFLLSRSLHSRSLQATGLILTIKGHSGKGNALAFSPDGTMLAIGHGGTGGIPTPPGYKVEIWNVRAGKLQHTLPGSKTSVYQVMFSRDSKSLIALNDGISVWDIRTTRLKRRIIGNFGYNFSLSPNGTLIAIQQGKENDWGDLQLIDISTGKIRKELKGHISILYDSAFSNDGKTIAAGGNDQKVRLWDVNTEKLSRTLSKHRTHIREVFFMPNGQTITSIDQDGICYLWSSKSGGVRRMNKGELFTDITVSDNRQHYATGSTSSGIFERTTGSVQIRELRTGKVVSEITDGIGGITSLALSADARTLAIGNSLSEEVQLWRISH